MNFGSDPVAAILRPERLTAVVDIGANPIDTDPPYKRMLANRLCTLVGFEPQAEGLATLNARKGDLETYLPYAVGDGTPGTLKICQAPGMTSLHTPNPRVLNCFPGFAHFGRVVKEIPIETRTLDSITEIQHLDFLKIDVQGSELAIFRNGSARLINAIAIQTEISFVPLYVNEPVFGQIDSALRALGFIPHMFDKINKRMILPIHYADNIFAAMNQLLEADIVYVRDFTQPEKMSIEQLKHLAMVAHHCYASYDLAANCINNLMVRNALPADSVERYLGVLRTAAAAAA
jgi:FkbM family methyltransferase